MNRNLFNVGCVGTTIAVHNTEPIGRGMSETEALNLAAWLVATAMRAGETPINVRTRFDSRLARVLSEEFGS